MSWTSAAVSRVLLARLLDDDEDDDDDDEEEDNDDDDDDEDDDESPPKRDVPQLLPDLCLWLPFACVALFILASRLERYPCSSFLAAEAPLIVARSAVALTSATGMTSPMM